MLENISELHYNCTNLYLHVRSIKIKIYTSIYNIVSHNINFIIHLAKVHLINETIDNMTTHCHNSKLQLVSITLLQTIADLTSMKVISFCTATLVCVDKRYTV